MASLESAKELKGIGSGNGSAKEISLESAKELKDKFMRNQLIATLNYLESAKELKDLLPMSSLRRLK